jgi:hypothetical protein
VASAMKLSEAIREGAKFKPKWQISYFNADRSRSCALGAACEATWPDIHERIEAGEENVLGLLLDAYPILRKRVLDPIDDMLAHLVHVIVRLNDGVGCQEPWTREQIADWVATVESEVQS